MRRRVTPDPGATLDSDSVCGICGIVVASGPVDRRRLAARSATLSTAGPIRRAPPPLATRVRGRGRSRSATWFRSDRPRANDDGTCTTVQGGEIDGGAGLTRERERSGRRFQTGSDTDSILHVNEERGLGFGRAAPLRRLVPR